MTLLFRSFLGGYTFLQLVSGLLLLLGSRPAAGQAPAFGPAVVVGATANGQSVVAGTAIDAQGYVYVTGSYYGTAQFGSFTLTSAITQAFVAKLDGAGAYQWIKTVDGPYFSAGSGLAVDATGRVTIIGHFDEATASFGPFTLTNANAAYNTSDIYVAQLDPDGTWLWASQAGGPDYDGPRGVALDAAGNVYVTGAYGSTAASFGPTTLTNANPATTRASSYDLFVAKLSPQGAWLWARGGGGDSHDGGVAVAADARGHVYLTGFTDGASATFGPFAVAGSSGTNDVVLVAKLDPDGTWLWVTTAGGGLNSAGSTGLALDAAGDAYVTGSFTSPTATFGATTLTNRGYGGGGYGDIFVAKLGAAGAWQWAVGAGSDKHDAGTALAFDGAGRLAVVGSFGGTAGQFGTFSLPNTAGGGGGSGGTFNPASVFLAYLSPAGIWLGAVASQGGGDEQAVAVAVDAHGYASVGGGFQGASLTLGTVTLPGTGSTPTPTGFVTLVPMVPSVASLAPGSGQPGQVVTITGRGFAGVTDVLFNGRSAAAFTVQSTTRLLATVPTGATAGPVRVLTGAGAGASAVPFQLLLATAAPAVTAALVWPNPAAVAEPWQVRVPGAGPTPTTQAEVHDLLGQIVFSTQFSGPEARLLVPRLAPGVYQLTLRPAGQPALRHRVAVAE